MNQIKHLRDALDHLDSQISSLLDQRMETVDEIGRIKRQHHLVVTDKSREAEVLDRVKTSVHHPVLKENMVNIYKVIMEESKVSQQFLQHTKLPFRCIGLIGLGLIGGSICKGLKVKSPSVEIRSFVDPSDDCIVALNEDWIDQIYTSLPALLQWSEVLIIASPISTVIPLAEEIHRLSVSLSHPLIIMDVASIKGEIVTKFEQLTSGQIEYVGTHPMAGKESKGFVNSQATLFVRRPWVVTPHAKNKSATIEAVDQMIRFLGGEPVKLEAEEHDRQAALISHLPGIISRAFYDFVLQNDATCNQLAGPGFHSFTRLAHSNGEMRLDIERYNQAHIHILLEQWVDYFTQRMEGET